MAKAVDREKELQAIMKDTDCTYEEAEEIFVIEEKARANGTEKVYAISEKPRKATKREPKIDVDKISIIDFLFSQLENSTFNDDLKIVNAQREISFNFQEENYSITLTKHRKNKGG